VAVAAKARGFTAEATESRREGEKEVDGRQLKVESRGTSYSSGVRTAVSAWAQLLAGEALEVGHLALHFLAGGVGGGADALDAKTEFVWVGGAAESFF
jgi:hypothetical protein